MQELQPTPVLLPGKFRGLKSLVGYTVHGVAKSPNTSEQLHYSLFTIFSSQVLSLLILMSFSAPFDFASGGFLAALPLISTS